MNSILAKIIKQQFAATGPVQINQSINFIVHHSGTAMHRITESINN